MQKLQSTFKEVTKKEANKEAEYCSKNFWAIAF